MSKTVETQWLFGFHFAGIWMWSLGFHIDPESPNIEMHIPFGFIILGRRKVREYSIGENNIKRFYGFKTKWKKYEKSKNNN